MASRPGSSANSNRQRSREPQDDYPSLSAPRLPPLRNIHSPRDLLSPAARESHPPPRRLWSTAASRRAERIRYLEERASALDDLGHSMEQSWLDPSRRSARRAERLRYLDERAQSLDDLGRSLEQSWLDPVRRASRLRALDHRRSNHEELDQTPDEANSPSRSSFDMSNHLDIMAPLIRNTFSPTLRLHDFPDDNRRSKRRKLDADRLVSSFKGFRYGKYGQVEPGQLHMEIVSCDGGMFSNQSSYAAENILKDDNLVYCTKGNRCNIVLRHQGATVFTLRELVIKAPGSNFSHPVREGMVFVSMSQDDLLSRTAQYQIQYAPSKLRSRAWHDQGDVDNDTRHIISILHNDDGTTSTIARRAYVSRGHDDDCENRISQMPLEFAHNLPDFRVTTECSDDDDDEDDDDDDNDDEHDMSRVFRRPPNRIGVLPFENPDSDSEDANPFGSDDFMHGSLHQPRRPRHGGRSRSGLPLTEACGSHANDSQEALRAPGDGDLLAPHARFYIEKKKSKCTIRFDPPVSGRFILLKIWSSQHDPLSNIDIQSVIARGFAGPRYFPSVALC
ncbi:hypothetical protein XA68_17991 [Ophiocordyceps unilateralis]|uniref:Uncharacterized protein n=1 Tax=Ophiocordyceps unilateralis TaxID=268505 RepID=A0A2A9P281_OPHUN|nr:hypothetical protein XA68_17991 [Ophiocordyceps unilateralis]